ncbi:MAG TPA: MurR/RpiR family transcriptional regulator [Beijerinckiaceae bacterium]|nr:MurR/RpiR family transcriptional regulator [Beijerinckiaceae bacterium]
MDDKETFDGFRKRLKEQYDSLSPHLQRIARYALEEPNTFALETTTTIADRLQVQPSTLIRFAKGFGYSGFSKLQQVFKLRLIEGGPDYRERAYRHRKRLQKAEGDALGVLSEFADASALNLERLKHAVTRDQLDKALRMLRAAQNIYLIGQRRAFPIAAYFAYGLLRLELRGHLLEFVGGMAQQQAATFGPKDLVVAISFAEYTPAVVDIVRDAHIRGVPIVAITDVTASPLAKASDVAFLVDDLDVHQFRPIAGAICLVQALLISLGRMQG